MKKIFAVLMAALMICAVFAGCSGKETGTEDTPTAATIPTEDAVINENDAIRFIEQMYTPEELGLADSKEEYSLMVSTSGVEVDGEKYVKVVANVKVASSVTTPEGNPTIQFKSIGEYLISYDAKKVLMKNMETGEYSELENRYEDYSSKGETAPATEK